MGGDLITVNVRRELITKVGRVSPTRYRLVVRFSDDLHNVETMFLDTERMYVGFNGYLQHALYRGIG